MNKGKLKKKQEEKKIEIYWLNLKTFGILPQFQQKKLQS